MKNVYSKAEAARTYDRARKLPAGTKTLWLDAIKSSLPPQKVGKILDLGCGTGRFTSALGETFQCPVIGVEPSAAMLEIAIARNEPNVEWKQGQAESLPLEAETVDLIFMSQVFHHLVEPERALLEIHRVLRPAGFLVIRNGMREHNRELAWLGCFPEAREIEDRRTPSSQELEELVCAKSFTLLSHRVINQLFASSFTEYFEKISGRGLSALLAISDESFQSGLERFRDWVNAQPKDAPVYEPMDLFIFQKKK
ncbi:MAG: methyltransferase domain-containing protein [Pyrinomonadaceae bacterium]|nr:methyltransferase domain-containing protein [Pyrinomonadaceae bacterium]